MKEAQEALVANVIAQLENGVAPWVRPWSTSGVSDMPHNLSTQKRYNGVNVLQLWMTQAAMGYATADWATFVQAKELGGSVRKGEKGTPIWFIQPTQFVKKNSATGEEESSNGVIWKQYFVFNRAQIDGLPELLPVDAPAPFDAIGAAEEYIRATGADIRFGGDRAYFAPGPDYIACPKPEAFVDPATFYATQLHELTHWSGHESRLARTFGKRFGDDAYAFEELVAELGSAFACAALGIAGKLRHAEYLGNWAQVLKNDPKALWTAGSQASKAVAFLDALAVKDDALELVAA